MIENKLLSAVLIIIAFWLASYLITLLMRLVARLASKTRTSLDDKIIAATSLPVRYLAIILGFYFAARYYGLNWSWQGAGVEEVFLILIVLLISFAFSRFLKTIFIWYGEKGEKGRMSRTMFVFVRKMISVLVYVLAGLFIFQQLGIEIGPLLAGLGIAGLAIALGLQETLANLFSALFLVMDRSINIGDWIQLEDGTKANIEDISWRSVRIRTLGGNAVIIPNSVFVGQKIISYDYAESSFFTSVQAGVAYGSDLEKVEKAATEAARDVIKRENIKAGENEPIIRFKELADSAINFSVIIKVDQAKDEGRIKHALIKAIVEKFRQEKIEIPFPQRVIHKAD